MSYKSRGLKQAYKIGARLTEEITYHKSAGSATVCAVSGSKGSGKTTFLLTLADVVSCIDPLTKKLEKETVIWRGRNSDSWNWLAKEKMVVFIHAKDFKTVQFMDDIRKDIPKSELPTIEKYVSFNHLLSRLRSGSINVIYEPSTYEITENIKDRIRERGMQNEDLFKNIKNVNPVIWWYELLDFLLHRKNHKFISVFWDEFDEIAASSPSGIAWHLQLWLKDIMKDLRKKKISLYLASHGISDFDGRLLTKIQYLLYMKGSITPQKSIVNHTAPIMLETGTYYIERDGWGLAKCRKIPEKTIVNVQLHPEITNGFYDEEWVDPADPGSIPLSPPEYTVIKGYEILRNEK